MTKKHINITGTSNISWKDAIVKTVSDASDSICNLSKLTIIRQWAKIQEDKIAEYYVDLDIQCNQDTYSFQIINNQEVALLFERLKAANIKINDPLNLIELYRDKDLVTLNKYLDNPRDDGFVQRLKSLQNNN